MDHVMFTQTIKKNKKDEYIKAHKNCWPELLEAHKDSGIEREIIWIYGDDILIYIMAENFSRAIAKLEKIDVFKDWITKIKPLMSKMQDYSGKAKIVKLDKVFDLEEQLDKIN